jgi:hypothetical protein
MTQALLIAGKKTLLDHIVPEVKEELGSLIAVGSPSERMDSVASSKVKGTRIRERPRGSSDCSQHIARQTAT